MLKNVNINFVEFMDVIDACEGVVYAITQEGDKINLKSRLSQMVGFTALLQDNNIKIDNFKCEVSADESKIIRYLIYGEVPRKKV